MIIKEAKNSVCSPAGFKASAMASGLRKAGRLDLGIIYSEVPAAACGLFTTNKFAAIPVIVCKENLKHRQAQVIVVNSGNANCFTGKKGMEAAKGTVAMAADLLKLKDNLVMVASTGIIGKVLDFGKIRSAMPQAVRALSRKGGHKFAEAIMTTDTKTKELLVKIDIGGKKVTIGGVAKGAGMIAPNMATMLCFITSDVSIQHSVLKKALVAAVGSSFNMITVDGCMSTNDSVLILANGLAKNKVIVPGDKNFYKFSSALKELCLGLAKMIVKDAEGATKFITIKVSGAKDDSQAKKAALQIANSNLFKTAVYGENPNMGRIVSAIGASGVEVEENMRIIYSSLKSNNIDIGVDLMIGGGSAVVYTSDLTPKYIKINAEYN